MANEVKRLAENSQTEANKIRPYLNEIAELFKVINVKVKNASAEFKDANKLNTEVGDSIQTIAETITELNERTKAFLSHTKTILAESEKVGLN